MGVAQNGLDKKSKATPETARSNTMKEEEFEKILREEIGEKALDKIKCVWLHFYGISLEESAAMFLALDSKTRALFKEGYELSRELDVLYKAAHKMKIDGLVTGCSDLFAYCAAKEKAYEAKAHAANLVNP